ncbi:MAG: polysaccharide biosynthesis C-terminal domain-containing protein, partial [Acholeplasma sp.]|nr:polysaccharide biosynthesis C-terminal domain-containing protein [Acholeplasma sp.]
STILAALINLVLNYVLINYIGMIGAALATLVSYIMLFLFHEFVARRIIKGYNINFNIYIPGILIVFISSLFSISLINYWLIRYCLVVLVCITLFIALKIYIKKEIKND